jgi:putative transposase
VVFWRLRYKLSLRDLPEMFLIRGIEFSYEAVRDGEGKLTPSLIDSLRRRRKRSVARPNKSPAFRPPGSPRMGTIVIHRVIRTELGSGVKHRTDRYLNNRIEQDHHGVKGRYGPVRGFKSPDSAARFCRGFNELRNHLYPRSRPNQNIPTNSRRQRFLQRGIIALRIMEAARTSAQRTHPDLFQWREY